MKNGLKWLSRLVIILIPVIGFASISGACWAGFYQGELPQKSK